MKRRHKQKLAISIMAVIASVLVIAAASANYAVQEKPYCSFESEVISCEEVNIADDGSVEISLRANEAMKDVRIILIPTGCKIEEATHFIEEVAQDEVITQKYSCDPPVPSLKAEIAVIFDHDTRDAVTGSLLVI